MNEKLTYMVEIEKQKEYYLVILSSEIRGSRRKSFFTNLESVERYLKNLKNHCLLMGHDLVVKGDL